ncbi:EndoU domain-containing protein [Sporolactobacillus terrae]|nr:EndoU domain-containing protein [Sporolactobacillus terrae]
MSKKDTQPVNPLLANATKAAIMDQEIQYGIRDGAKDAVKDTVLGLWESATHPVETLKGTWHAATHPIQTANLIKNALVQSFDKEMVHGNAYTRTRWVTYAITTLATSIVGTKGVDKISKVAKAGKIGEAASKVRNTIKTTRTKSTAWVNQKLDQWSSPPLPRTQFANSPIPYNVIDTKGLRDKLQQLPDRTAPLPNQIDQVRDLIQQASVKNVDAVSQDPQYTLETMKHIYHGIVNKHGKAVGYHHESMMEGEIVSGTEKVPDKNRVYMAKVKIDNVRKIADSSFFPKDWNRAEVIRAIDEAYQSRKPIRLNKYRGITSSGIKIEMYLNKDGSIATAYPLYKK